MPPRRRDSETQVALGQAIKAARLERALSQEALAHAADLHPTWVSHIESGKNPTWATVARLAAALGLPLSELARRVEALEEGPPPPPPARRRAPKKSPAR